MGRWLTDASFRHCNRSNEELEDTPSLLIEEPYGDGWLIKVKPSNLEEDLKELIHGEEVVLEWLKKEIAGR